MPSSPKAGSPAPRLYTSVWSLTLAITLLLASVAGAALIIAVAPKSPIPVESDPSAEPADLRLRPSLPDSRRESVFVHPPPGPRGR